MVCSLRLTKGRHARRDNHRIQVFSADGALLRMFGVYGEGEAEFLVPVGVAVNGAGEIVVADSAQHKVKVRAFTHR
jgi:hypothetical protein